MAGEPRRDRDADVPDERPHSRPPGSGHLGGQAPRQHAGAVRLHREQTDEHSPHRKGKDPMTHPDADQITSTVRDFERALAGPVRCAFDAGWTLDGPTPADLSELFDDPAISPLYERSTRVRQTARAHLAAGTADIANPMRPEEGTHRVTEVVGEHDPLAVFAADPMTWALKRWMPNSYTCRFESDLGHNGIRSCGPNSARLTHSAGPVSIESRSRSE